MSILTKFAVSGNNNTVVSQNNATPKSALSSLRSISSSYSEKVATEESQNNGGFLGGLGYLGEKIGLGFLSGIEGIWDYAAGGLAKLFGADDWAEQQFANDWVNYNDADEWYNPSDGWKFAGDVAGGIGTSLPAIAGVAAAAAIAYFSGGSLSAVSAGLISASIAGLGAAGQGTKEAYQQTGELGGKEFGYGALVGVTEGAVEGLSAGLGVGTGQIVKGITKSFGKEVATATVKSAARQTAGKAIVSGFVGEAFEEGLSEFLTPYWKRLTYDPNAKNATVREIGYAALIGGLSGAIMGGFDTSVRNVSNIVRGNNVVNSGKAADIIATAENISANETENATGYESYQAVQNILTELKTSLDTTNGEITTTKQKMLLGYLEQANTAAAFAPALAKNAERIYQNADAIAERLTAYGYKDSSGNAITYTAEQIREGIDPNKPSTFANALKTNSILRTLAVVDATGQIYMDTQRFADSTLKGEQLSSQVDLNRFIETASEPELQAVAEKLQIQDWKTLTNDEFKSKIIDYVDRGGVQEYQTEQQEKSAIQAIDPATAKTKIPKTATLKADGTVRYTQSGVDMAITKKGDSYRIYNYETGLYSKPMTKTEVNAQLKVINSKFSSATSENVNENVDITGENVSESTAISKETAEIDGYARKNVSAYAKLSDANRNLVRGVIRQARAAGISESDALSYARVSAQAGVNIVFGKSNILLIGENTETHKLVYADGVYLRKDNTIYVNPESTRPHEKLLIHELTHAVYKTKGGAVIIMDGVENMTQEEKDLIIARYKKQGYSHSFEFADEINAHYAEGLLTNKGLIRKLTEAKPALKEKILSFFKKSTTAYPEDEKLTGAAKRLYKQYQKMFDSFSAENQHNNSVETAEESNSQNYALPETLKTLGQYTDEEIKSIETTKLFKVSRSYSDVKDFISQSLRTQTERRLFLGKITSEVATKIKESTGLDVDGKSVALSSSDIRHIFKGHSNAQTESLQGQVAINETNFENVIETIIEPDTVEKSIEDGRTGIIFKKNIDGKVAAVTILSEKKKALTLKSAWITKEKQSTSLTPNVQALSITSETGQRIKTVSSNSISKKDNKVNTSLEKILDKYENDTDYLVVRERNDIISINNIVVKPKYRNNGVGTRIVNKIIDYADKTGKTITLTPTSEFGTKERLKSWYKKFGFVENKGKNTDLRLSDTMYRLPKTSNKLYAISEAESDGTVYTSDNENIGLSLREEQIIDDFFVIDDFFEKLSLKEFQELIYEDIDTEKTTNKEAKLDKNETRLAYINKLYENGKLNSLITKLAKDKSVMWEYFKNSKMNQKYNPLFPTSNDELVVMFHGSPNEFYSFDSKKIGKNGTVMGSGFYFTESKEYAEGYSDNKGGKVIAALLKIEKPLSRNKYTITKQQVKDFVREAVDNNGKGWLSNYGSVESLGYEQLLNKTINKVYEHSRNDADLIESIYVESNIDFDEYYGKLTDKLGYDGIISWNKAEGTQAIIFKSNQAKDILNFKPTKSDDIRYAIPDDDVRYSISEADGIRDGQIKYYGEQKSKFVSESMLQQGQQATQAMVDIMREYASILPQDKVGQTILKNGSYDRSVENTTICVRTLAYNEFVDKVQERIGRPLTQMESFLVSQKLYEIAKDPQCLYCYVSLDRKAYNSNVLRYFEQRDSVIKAWNDSGKKLSRARTGKDAVLYQKIFLGNEWKLNKKTNKWEWNDGNGRKDTEPMWNRFNTWLNLSDSQEKLLTAADVRTEALKLKAKSDTGAIGRQYRDMNTYAQNASQAKIQREYVAYRDEILRLSPRIVSDLNKHYGLRWYSFSDYSGAFIVENMQQMTDASIRGLKGLSYTKDTDYAKIFAPTGMAINISVFIRQHADGTFYVDERQSANIDEAIELRNQYPNVGIVAVATDDSGVEWAMAQDWSDVVIPFHIVRTGLDVANFYKWLNYTSESSDTVADADLWEAYKTSVGKTKVSKNIYPSEHQNDLQTYLKLCKERGLKPRFERFLENPSYMKLVNETRLSAAENKPLQPTFDLEAAQVAFKKFVDKGGYWGSWYNEDVNVDLEAAQVASDVVAGKKANEVEYGRQDIDFDTMLKNRRKVRQHGGSFALPTDEDYLAAVERGETDSAAAMVESYAWNKGYKVEAYHGSTANFTIFDTGKTGKGIDQFGAGFYFASNKDVTDRYGDKTYHTYLKLEKPIRILRTLNNTGDLFDVKITQKQAYEILKRHPLMYDPEQSPLGDYCEEFWNVGVKDYMIRDLAKQFTNIGQLDADHQTFRDYPDELHKAIREVIGYDGVWVHWESQNFVDERNDEYYIAWFPNQIKSAETVTHDADGKVIPLSERFSDKSEDIRYALPNTRDSVTTEIEQEYKPTVPDKIFSGWTAIQIAFTNEQAGIEKVGKKLGIKNVESLVQAARSGNKQAEEMIAGNQYRIGADNKTYQGKGLEQIFRPINEQGVEVKTDFFDYLFNYHNISRRTLESRSITENNVRKATIKKNAATIKKTNKLIEKKAAQLKTLGRGKKTAEQRQALHEEINSLKAQAKLLRADTVKLQAQVKNFVPLVDKPVLDVSAAESRQIVAAYEAKYPDFKTTADEVWKFLQNLNQYRVDTGLLAQDTADYLADLYPNYVPTYRVGATKGIGAISGKYNLAVKSTIKTAKGSIKDLLPPDVMIARQVMETVRAGRVNQLANALYEGTLSNGDSTYIEIISREKVNADEMADIDPTELRPKNNEVTFFRDGERITMRVSKEVFAGFNAFSPTMEVQNPLVNGAKAINNGFKRLVTSLNPAFLVRNSVRDIQDAGIYTKYGKTFLKNYARAAKQISTNGEFWQLYKAMGGFSSSVFDFEKGMVGKQNKWGLTKAEGNILGRTLTTVENANAFVEQLPRLAEFISSLEAGNTAEQAVLDSADVTTNFGRTGAITKRLNSTLIPFLNPAIQGCSKFIRTITSARTAKEISKLVLKIAIVGIIPQLLNQLLYEDDEDYKNLRDTDKENNFLFKVGDTFIKIPKGRVASVFAGIVNRSEQMFDGDSSAWDGYLKNVLQQVTPVENLSRTIFSPFADVKNNVAWYGSAIEGRQFENVAPKDRYDESTSSIAIALGKLINYSPKKLHYLLDQYSGVIGDFILPATTARAEKGFLSGNFTLDPTASNKLSADFYEIYDEAQYAKTSGDENAAYTVKYLNKVKGAISDLYKQKSEIQNSDLNDSEKIAQTKVLQALINEAYKTAMTDLPLFKNAVSATESVDSTLRYSEITRLMYGAEKALEEYDSDVYDKCKLLSKAGLSYNVLYNYYFGTKGIESDTDKSGKAISGSKRSKVVAAIDNLSLSIQQKLLLICSKGYSLQDGDVGSLTADQAKRMLLRYLISLKGATKDEKAELAELCGFAVKNGRIVPPSLYGTNK